MSLIFFGPLPIALSTAQPDTQAALNQLREVLRSPGSLEALSGHPTSPGAPGLYLLVEPLGEAVVRSHARLTGLWIRFGPDYAASGPAPGADHSPPYAAAVLEAMTEELWWRTLPVQADAQGMARLPLVLEWPPNLARRAELAPPDPELVSPVSSPGKGEQRAHERSQSRSTLRTLDEDDDLDLGPDALTSPPVEPELTDPGWISSVAPVQAPGPGRSLITRVVLTMIQGPRLHRASFALSAPPLDRPWPDWLYAPGGEARATPQHALAGPLPVGDESEAYALEGWLARGLGVWPPRPADVLPGAVPDRVLQNRQLGQLVQALTLVATVLLLVVGISVSLGVLARPRDKDRPSDPPRAPQPALSVCSAYHQRYVEELRCQILGMAEESGDLRNGPRCGDPTDTPVDDPNLRSPVDVRPLVCGIADRAQDGWRGRLRAEDPEQDWLRIAAAQACFNVMGYPPNWSLQGHPTSVDVDKMLDPGARGIAPLVAVVGELEQGCAGWRPRVEGTVQGAILDAQVGEPYDEQLFDEHQATDGQRIRRHVTELIANTLSSEQARCLRSGGRALMNARSLEELCMTPAEFDHLGLPQRDGSKAPKAAQAHIWTQLDGELHAESAVLRYTQARFGDEEQRSGRLDQTVPLWQCHLDLLGSSGPLDVEPRPVSWGLVLEEPELYPGLYRSGRRTPAVRNQLELDAIFTRAQEISTGYCWTWITDALRTYAPVHPLLRELEEDEWPSSEQQLCGQICATYYQVRDRDGGPWVTPGADLVMCMEPKQRSTQALVASSSSLDTLSLPWSGTPGWVRPTNADVCAFHLIAQEWFSQGRDGYVGSGQSGKSWAGETRTGSGLAGGEDGLATLAITELMESASGSWSPSYCGFVASECYTGLLLAATGEPGSRPFEWERRWTEQLKAANKMKPQELAATHPWCTPLTGHLLDQGQITDDGVRARPEVPGPCLAAFVESRDRARAALDEMIGRATGVVAAQEPELSSGKGGQP